MHNVDLAMVNEENAVCLRIGVVLVHVFQLAKSIIEGRCSFFGIPGARLGRGAL